MTTIKEKSRSNIPEVKFVDREYEEELFINGKSVCVHKRLYPSEVLEELEKQDIINYTYVEE